jgi:DNA-binding beta-propeller fold protein YncE
MSDMAAQSLAAAELLVADRANNQIVAFDPVSGAFKRTLVSTGLDEPTDLAFGPGGALYVADRGSGNVLKFDPVTGAALGTFVGGIAEPAGLLYDSVNDELFVAELDNFSGDNIFRFIADGTPAGTITTAPYGHYGLAFGPNGNLFASDFITDASFNGAVSQYDMANNFAPLGTYASGGGLVGAAGLAFDASGDLYVASLFGQSVVRYDSSGNLIGTFASLAYPTDLLFAPDGDLWVTSLGNNNPGDPIYGEFLFPGAVFKLDATTGLPIPFATLGESFMPTAVLLSPVPEPSGLLLMALGSALLGRLVRRKR